MTDEQQWLEFQHEARDHIDEVIQEMLASEDIERWHKHATHVLADLLVYQEQYAIHRMRGDVGFVPLGDIAEA
jgi:hypothetical protein